MTRPAAMTDPALDGVRVLDLSGDIAGDFCARFLAELGADVIKVESPGGDPVRHIPPFLDGEGNPEAGAVHLYVNTNKRSVTLDVNRSEARPLLEALLAPTQLVVHTLRRREAGALELDAEGVEARRRRGQELVVVAITPFGHTGPYADWQADEFTLYALCGAMSFTGDPDREPLAMYGYVPLYQTGLLAAAYALAGLTQREQAGEGQFIDVSVMETGASALEDAFELWGYQGRVRNRAGNRLFNGGPSVEMLPTADGVVAFCAVTELQWQSLCLLVEHPEWLEDPSLQTWEERTRQAEQLLAAMRQWFAARTSGEAMETGQTLRIPIFALRTVPEMLQDPQAQVRGFFQQLEHPVAGPLTYPGSAIDFPAGTVPLRPAPLLGQHNGEVYRSELGLSEANLAELQRAGVV